MISKHPSRLGKSLLTEKKNANLSFEHIQILYHAQVCMPIYKVNYGVMLTDFYYYLLGKPSIWFMKILFFKILKFLSHNKWHLWKRYYLK